MNKPKNEIAVPADMVAEIEARVANGEFKSMPEVVATALRYYFERHGQDNWADYVKEEIQAGLHESD